MTPRAWDILRWLSDMEMAPHELEYDAEIVCEGLACWLGTTRLRRSTVNQLLRVVALTDASDTEGVDRYVINETGRSLLRRPELESEITAALRTGTGAWTLRNDRLVAMTDAARGGDQ